MVEPAEGLVGFCDYLLARSPDALLIEAPVLAVVEAKKEDIPGGDGPCIAEMEAARRFNDAAGTPRPTIYGAVTTGDIWSFLSLENGVVTQATSGSPHAGHTVAAYTPCNHGGTRQCIDGFRPGPRLSHWAPWL